MLKQFLWIIFKVVQLFNFFGRSSEKLWEVLIKFFSRATYPESLRKFKNGITFFGSTVLKYKVYQISVNFWFIWQNFFLSEWWCVQDSEKLTSRMEIKIKFGFLLTKLVKKFVKMPKNRNGKFWHIKSRNLDSYEAEKTFAQLGKVNVILMRLLELRWVRYS